MRVRIERKWNKYDNDNEDGIDSQYQQGHYGDSNGNVERNNDIGDILRGSTFIFSHGVSHDTRCAGQWQAQITAILKIDVQDSGDPQSTVILEDVVSNQRHSLLQKAHTLCTRQIVT